MPYILIAGASSDIAKALAKKYAHNGYDLYLAAQKPESLDQFAQNLHKQTQRSVINLSLNILDFTSHSDFYQKLPEKPEGVICAVGYLGNQHRAQNTFTEAEKIIDSNYTGIVSLLNIIANDFETRKRGFIIGISSVAGDRGRQSNYLYGSAKAALSTYLSGLRNRLHHSNVNVLTVKPGFVTTKMTAHMTLPAVLTTKPSVVANAIYQAQQKRKAIIYTKPIWRGIMWLIQHIPEAIFKRMHL